MEHPRPDVVFAAAYVLIIYFRSMDIHGESVEGAVDSAQQKIVIPTDWTGARQCAVQCSVGR